MGQRTKAHPEQAYRLCLGLLSLTREYPSERVNNSCRLANAEGLTRLKQIKSILKNNRDLVPADRDLHPSQELPQELRNMKTSVARATSTKTGDLIMPHTLMKQLTEMKLTGMAAALSSQMEQPGTYEELSFRERLALLVTRESLERDQRKQKRLLQKVRLRLEASVHDIDYQPARNLERSRIAQLSQNEWVVRGQNLLITGPCGCGKTYVGYALGNNACQQGYSVQYWRLSRLLVELTHSRADGSYRKQLAQLSKTQLLILRVSSTVALAITHWQTRSLIV